MDYDSVNIVNLDRLIGATLLDVWLRRSKVEVAKRLSQQNATAEGFRIDAIEGSVCEPNQFARALDYDLIFCCVDEHPWPRSVLNTIAYSDLIPVIDGGIHVDAFPDGGGMRNATWRSHILRPGRPCMICNRQLEAGMILADKDGLLKDASYIAGLPPADRPQNQNVATLAISAAAALLTQFVSYTVAPAGMGDPGPLRHTLSIHLLERVKETTGEHCSVESGCNRGDHRAVLLDEHPAAQDEMRRRRRGSSRPLIRIARAVDDTLAALRARLEKIVARNLVEKDALAQHGQESGPAGKSPGSPLVQNLNEGLPSASPVGGETAPIQGRYLEDPQFLGKENQGEVSPPLSTR